MGFEKEEYDDVPEYSDYMLLFEAAEREGKNIRNNNYGSTLVHGDENKTKDSVAATNSTVVDLCPWWFMVPRKKRTPKILCRVKALRESTSKSHVMPIMFIRDPTMAEWMDTLIQEYCGTGVVLVLQKCLKKSDVDNGQRRFSIPQRQIVNEFLTRKECKSLHRNDRISVTLIQPYGETGFAELRKWNLATSFSYVLAKTWNDVVKNPRNELKEGIKVQLGAFRVVDSMNFAMIMVEKSKKEDDGVRDDTRLCLRAYTRHDFELNGSPNLN